LYLREVAAHLEIAADLGEDMYGPVDHRRVVGQFGGQRQGCSTGKKCDCC
jgi:hypothetical protein